QRLWQHSTICSRAALANCGLRYSFSGVNALITAIKAAVSTEVAAAFDMIRILPNATKYEASVSVIKPIDMRGAQACSRSHPSRPMRAFRAPPVDTLKQHRQLCRTQVHRARLRVGPHKVARLQAFGKQTHADLAPPEHLDAVTSAPAKHKDVPTERVCLQRVLHDGRQAIESPSHVGDACRK